MKAGKLVVATRLHASSPTSPPDVGGLAHFCQQALRYADEVLVATDAVCNPPARQALAQLRPRVRVLLVSPWESFTPALNALLAAARRNQAAQILYQSLEVGVTPADVALLQRLAGPEVLVVGGKLIETHGGPPGRAPISGHTGPWNTLALWDVELLSLTGFLAVSDGLHDREGGAEEAAVISLLQHLRPGGAEALLTALPGLTWNTCWEEDSRLEHHRWKMPTKRARAEAQLERLQIPRGTVQTL